VKTFVCMLSFKQQYYTPEVNRYEANKMHKLILDSFIYYCSITPTCFGHLIEAIIREFKILESYKPLW